MNPRNSAAKAYVEYKLATDMAYEASLRIPLAPDTIDVGAGNEFATNVAGTTFGADRTFRTRPQIAAPPPGRGYEMVSPLDKNGGDISRDHLIEGPTSQAAPSGDAAAGRARYGA